MKPSMQEVSHVEKMLKKQLTAAEFETALVETAQALCLVESGHSQEVRDLFKDVKTAESRLVQEGFSLPEICSLMFEELEDRLRFSREADELLKMINWDYFSNEPSIENGHSHSFLQEMYRMLFGVPDKEKHQSKAQISEIQKTLPSGALSKDSEEDQWVDFGVLWEMKEFSVSNFETLAKIVYVFCTFGYGVKHYHSYLESQNLQRQEWQFFNRELIEQQKYQPYLEQALQAALSMIDHVLSFRDQEKRRIFLKEFDLNRLIQLLSFEENQTVLSREFKKTLGIIFCNRDKKVSLKTLLDIDGLFQLTLADN